MKCPYMGPSPPALYKSSSETIDGGFVPKPLAFYPAHTASVMCEVPLQCLGELKFILSINKQKAGTWTYVLPGSSGSAAWKMSWYPKGTPPQWVGFPGWQVCHPLQGGGTLYPLCSRFSYVARGKLLFWDKVCFCNCNMYYFVQILSGNFN